MARVSQRVREHEAALVDEVEKSLASLGERDLTNATGSLQHQQFGLGLFAHARSCTVQKPGFLKKPGF